MIAMTSNLQALFALVEGGIVFVSLIGCALLWRFAYEVRADSQRRRAADNVTRISDYTRRERRPAA